MSLLTSNGACSIATRAGSETESVRGRRLIAIFGTARSGTTWLASILNSYPRVVYSHEPFSRLHGPFVESALERIKTTGSISDAERVTLMETWTRAYHDCHRPPFFAKDFNQTPGPVVWLAWLAVRSTGHGSELFRRLFSPRDDDSFDLLIKQGSFGIHARAFVQALNPTLLVIIRHPCAVVASRLRGHRSGLMPIQEMREWLEFHGRQAEQLGFDRQSVLGMDLVEFLALEWLVENAEYERTVEAHSDSMIVVYEELCRRSVDVTANVFELLGWELTDQTLKFIESSTGTHRWFRPFLQSADAYFSVYQDSTKTRESWKSQLSSEQSNRILSLTQAMSDRYWPRFEDRVYGLVPASQSPPVGEPCSSDRQNEDPLSRLWEGMAEAQTVASGTYAEPAITPPAPIPLIVHSRMATRFVQPLKVGVPLPEQTVFRGDKIQLLDQHGQAITAQTSPLATWPDGSLKWLLLDVLFDGLPEGDNQCSIEVTRNDNETSEDKAGTGLCDWIQVFERGGAIVVNTGHVEFWIDRKIFRPFTRVILKGTPPIDRKSSDAVLIDFRGHAHVAKIDDVQLESCGPVRTTLLFKGEFQNCRGVRFSSRLSFFVNSGLVKIQFTLHNPNRARHRGGLWDLGDPGSFMFRELSLGFSAGDAGQTRTLWKSEVEQPFRSAPDGRVEIYQDSSGGENWQSRNHVNRHGRVPCRFRGYRTTSGGREESGLRASPVLSVENSAGHLVVATPEFWQQFPKSLSARDGQIRVGLFPPQCDDLFELQGGEQKTHDVWVRYDSPRNNSSDDTLACALDWVHQPARLLLDAEWVAQSSALEHFVPVKHSPDDRLDSVLQSAVQGERSFFAGRERIDEYGWRNFGDIHADHEEAYYRGPLPVISHYNNQFDCIFGLIQQFLRTGDPRWYDLLDPLARHVIDIDIYHTDQDKPAYNGGLFWFTDHYKDASTSTHRTYSRANCPTGNSDYGGGPSSNHNFTTGLLYYYYLTGEHLACNAVIQLADWVINMDDGGNTVFSLIDDGPTGLASCSSGLEYHGPGRGCGNSVNALLDAWLLTNGPTYLDKAESLIRRSVHPNDDVAARNLLDVEKRWSYTVFFSSLSRYLDLKSEIGQRDFMYAYARESLLHYSRWMVDHEVPYFDQLEKLEYPTEAWAVQEIRKANVLRVAAKYADPVLRDRLWKRGMELVDRAWFDLMRFESRTTARAIAVLLVEGTKDSAIRSHCFKPDNLPCGRYDFGIPELFVPQKLRVLSQVMTARGLGKILLRLLRPTVWQSWLARRSRRTQRPGRDRVVDHAAQEPVG